MAPARSSLENRVVAIMRSLRERGQTEAEPLPRRLDATGADALERVPGLRRITSAAGGRKSLPVPENIVTGR
ncbi:MAG TPA: hypothetical protein VFP55_00935 [Solirubrobacteraceae bacterium]|nr:hypothetical protein [Solirubrobacteraceae bacterium]